MKIRHTLNILKQELNENEKTGKWKVEVHGVGDAPGHFSSNAKRFDTKEEAEKYLKELEGKWFGFDDSRVVQEGIDEESMSPEVLKWRKKQPKGKIMKPEKFKAGVEAIMDKQGLSKESATKIMGKTYWKTVKEKYKKGK